MVEAPAPRCHRQRTDPAGEGAAGSGSGEGGMSRHPGDDHQEPPALVLGVLAVHVVGGDHPPGFANGSRSTGVSLYVGALLGVGRVSGGKAGGSPSPKVRVPSISSRVKMRRVPDAFVRPALPAPSSWRCCARRCRWNGTGSGRYSGSRAAAHPLAKPGPEASETIMTGEAQRQGTSDGLGEDEPPQGALGVRLRLSMVRAETVELRCPPALTADRNVVKELDRNGWRPAAVVQVTAELLLRAEAALAVPRVQVGRDRFPDGRGGDRRGRARDRVLATAQRFQGNRPLPQSAAPQPAEMREHRFA